MSGDSFADAAAAQTQNPRSAAGTAASFAGIALCGSRK